MFIPPLLSQICWLLSASGTTLGACTTLTRFPPRPTLSHFNWGLSFGMSEAWRERGGSFGAKCTSSADASDPGGLLGVVDRGFPNTTFRPPLTSGLFLIQMPAPLLIAPVKPKHLKIQTVSVNLDDPYSFQIYTPKNSRICF